MSNKLGWPILVAMLVGGVAEAQERKVPYWASIATGDALMRTGPERTYPATWRYRRRDLPVQVLQVYGNWRRIREQDGTEGWMLATLLSAQRTAIVTGDGPAEMHADPDAGSGLAWRVEPGVVGRISHCADGWCLFDAAGRKGYVRTDRIWGVDPGETVE
jgi:SH3-like domain-containing protein